MDLFPDGDFANLYLGVYYILGHKYEASLIAIKVRLLSNQFIYLFIYDEY